MKLRAARPSDADATGAILSEFVAKTAWMPTLHSSAEDRGFCLRMIERGWMRVVETSQVLGFIARNDIEINALYVGAAYRGQGAGAALLKEAQSACDHLKLWTFQDNIGARRFYAAHGFHEVSRTDGQQTDEKLPDVQLEWKRR
jgi:GNAT superfamily N-acetyltransferase